MANLNTSFYTGVDRYSDGDAVEQSLLAFARSGKNVMDLPKEQVDFATLYHFAAERENILNWYPFKKSDSVLEIGAGCGAISGVLCKLAGKNTAVELSYRRASINFERHKDYNNLEICVGNLNDMTFPEKFDYVVLNGVFEYAASFTEGDTPYLSFLRKIVPLMKQGGKLLIAIENRLGMKYFSGAPEDHLDGYFIGLNDYEPNSPVRTFSHDELAQLVKRSGLACQRFYYPYPDYKFPKEVFTDESLADFEYGKPQINLNPLRRQLFREESIDGVLAREGAAASIANSFLLEASAEELAQDHVIYAKMNLDRAPAFRQITTVWSDGDKRRTVKRAVGETAKAHIAAMACVPTTGNITAVVGKADGNAVTFPFVEQASIGSAARALVLDDKHEAAKKMIDEYLTEAFSGVKTEEPYDTAAFRAMFGPATTDKPLATACPINIDLIADNVMRTAKGLVAIDPEWIAKFPVPVLFVVWRALNEFYANVPQMERYLPPADWYAEYGIDAELAAVFLAWGTYFAKEYVKSNSIEKYNIVPASPETPMITSTLYYDTGEGYSEAQKIEKKYLLRDGRFALQFDLPATEKPICALRWDPTKRQPCKCVLDYFEDQAGTAISVEPKESDFTTHQENEIAFYIPDTECYAKTMPTGISTLKVSGSIRLLTLEETMQGRDEAGRQAAERHAAAEKLAAEAAAAATAEAALPPPVDIVIPVYNAYEDLVLCIESVKRHTDLVRNRIILVNDASPDARIAPYLDSLAGPNILVHHNEGNKGFSANVNYGFASSQEHDVLLLNTDTIVTAGWLDKISACAARDKHIASVTPLSNAATLCSIPDFCKDNKLPEGYTVDSFGELVEKASMHLYPRVTVAVGFCMYIKREVIRKVGDFDAATFERGYGEENDFCNRAMLLGYYHVMCDDTFIFHSGSASFNAAEGTSKAKLIQAHDAILRKRYPDLMHQNDVLVAQNPNGIVQQNIWLHLALDPACKTIFLVSHRDFRKEAADSVGGVQLHVKDLAMGLSDTFNVVVAARNNEMLDVTAYHKNRTYTMRFLIGPQPVTPRMYDPALHKLFKQLMQSLGADLVHIQHIYGLSLEAFYAAKELGLPLFCTLHDYYYICPRIKLMDGQGKFCDGCTDTEQCDRCMQGKNDFGFEMPAGTDFVGQWRSETHEALALCDKLIAPSQTALDYYEKVFPDMQARGVAIAHGIDMPAPEKEPEAEAAKKEFHVAFLGGINKAKGSEIAYELITGDAATMWYIIGGLGDSRLENLEQKNLKWTGWYDRDHVAEILRENKIDLVCIPSVWPETFCYTVSEASECGIPVLCYDVGAQGERVKERALGWTVPLAAGAAGMQEMINKLRTRPEEYQQAVAHCNAQPRRITKQMIDEYKDLYQDAVAGTEKHTSAAKKLLRMQATSGELLLRVQQQQNELNRIEYSPGYHTLVKVQNCLLSKKFIRRLLKI